MSVGAGQPDMSAGVPFVPGMGPSGGGWAPGTPGMCRCTFQPLSAAGAPMAMAGSMPMGAGAAAGVPDVRTLNDTCEL